ncbi:MAG: TonB-dependent receptor [Balneolaceae bacterium]|nr:TonB-dependent receptor [Balneolaceae bacterium]
MGIIKIKFKWIQLVVLTFFICSSIGLQEIIAESNSPSGYEDRITISGMVVDSRTGQSLAGVNIVVRGTIVGVATNTSGEFTLRVNAEPPVTIVASIIGYSSQEIEITEQTVTDLRIGLTEETILGTDIVVSASRIEQSILEAPVSIEKMDIITVNQTAAPSYYHALANLKGVDMTASSINFQIINARGFNSTGNTRMVQLTDGMDTQAPALNFPIGNLNGPSVLDVESVEFIPGASSALYGSNAFNGILLVNSKNPYRYPGLSVHVQSGLNHIGGNTDLGEPSSPRPMYDISLRYADVVGERFAYKATLSYSRADDWLGIDFSDKNSHLAPSGVSVNPAYDGVHLYGDDGTFNLALLAFSDAFIQNLSTQLGMPIQDAQQFAMNHLPNQPVARTGYNEEHLVDHNAENLKFGTSLHYRLSDNLEASYTLNYGAGTSVYSGAQRYSLKNFYIHQHKIEFEGNNFMARAYGTFENSGDSYIADFVGYYINGIYSDCNEQLQNAGQCFTNPGRGNEIWFGTYGIGYLGTLAQGIENTDQLHTFARNIADQNRYSPDSREFDEAKSASFSANIPEGAIFNDNSLFLHTEGLYDFTNYIHFLDLQIGLSFRQYQLRSNGTIFDDADGGVNINEYGGFIQAAKSFLDDRIRFTGSVRYDKNENFDGQFNPRISSVIHVTDNQNFRTSYQTGFRNPTTQGQYIDLDVLTARLLGGLSYLAEKYNITENAFTLESVDRFINQLLTGNPAALLELEPYTQFDPVRPEQIQSFEIGYKGLFGNLLLIDAAYYYNIYDNFIAQFRVRRAAGPINLENPADPMNQQIAPSLLTGNAENTFQLYTNLNETVHSHGAAVGFDYSLPRNYHLSVNYNWNRLITEQQAGFVFDFNTPEHKVNFSIGNRRLTDRLGFNLIWRWQDEFEWTSTFANGTVPAVSTLDAQVTWRVPNLNSVIKVGGSNILNNRHYLNYGGPNLGAIYYISYTFDQFLN